VQDPDGRRPEDWDVAGGRFLSTVPPPEDVGRRAAVALETARLHEERETGARTLQRSLLPPTLPAIPGIELAARYRPAGAGDEVGGDFYDCFATGDGEWALVVGDVSGRGAEAAAVAGLARCTMRAAVMEDRRPAAVLRELNATMLGDGGDFGFCAAVYVALRPRADGADARLAVGGHPLPLLVRADGGVEATGDTGTVLGAVADPALGEASVRLAAGDALVLFTDGVVEPAPAGSALTVERLAELLGRCAGRNAEEIADAVERRALAAQSGHPRDDLAVVVLRPV
jgi:serine phosphatase RsbU (regulator of sigma subunit)